MVDVYYEKEICYSDNINKKAEYKWSDQMEAAQRIRLIRIIEKMGEIRHSVISLV